MFLWAEAVATACYTQNRSLIHTRHNKTPYELVHDKKPDLTFFESLCSLLLPSNDSVAAESTLMENNPFAPVDNDPFVNVFAPEPSFEASSSGDLFNREFSLCHSNTSTSRKWSKDHLLDNIIASSGKKCGKNYSSVRRYVVDPVNVFLNGQPLSLLSKEQDLKWFATNSAVHLIILSLQKSCEAAQEMITRLGEAI
ncbi:hypothetical protein Tco_0589262 [Tanacetum coccineum]